MCFAAALQEMSGKERQLATDPDCSIILERMIYSMDDFARRVLADRFCARFGRRLIPQLYLTKKKSVMKSLQSIGSLHMLSKPYLLSLVAISRER